MNKKNLLPVAIAALMGVAYLAKPATAQTEGFSDIQLANVEALADVEGIVTIEFHVGCLSNGDGCCLSTGVYHPVFMGVYADDTTD